jgi:hypothetical protein
MKIHIAVLGLLHLGYRYSEVNSCNIEILLSKRPNDHKCYLIMKFEVHCLKLCVLYSCREDNEILGSYMLIHGVRREDFGQYTCQISNTWFQSVDTSVWLREIGKENSF